jgi:tetratricopeptide (TPR) repeat protein
MIVRNEEKNLYDCVAPVLDLFDEVVINDTGSTDRTREIARSLGPKVKLIESTWPDSFAAARNLSLDHASGDWIFWLDADDRVDRDNHDKLAALFATLKNDNAAYDMKCYCVPDPRNPSGTFVDHIRLFRNHPLIRWQCRVHEQILPAVRNLGGEVRFADVVITHIGYKDPALRARKLVRDLPLVRKDLDDAPDEPFGLFNLGSILQEQGQHAEALPVLRRSLAHSNTGASIVRKLYALIAGCHQALGQFKEALAVYAEGKGVCPGDAELLYREAGLLRDVGDYRAAEASCLELLASKPGPYFASVNPGLREFRGHELLATIYTRAQAHAEALVQWRLLTERWPDFLPGWQGLAENALTRSDWELLEQAAVRIEGFAGCALEAALLRARGLMGRGEFAPARARLEGLAAEHSRAIGPRWWLSLVCVQDGSDAETTEQALRAVLLLDPAHPGAQHNLAVLLRQRTRNDDAFFEARGNIMAQVLGDRHQAACLEPAASNEHLPALHELARECPHITALGTHGRAGLALLRAQPKKLVYYDLVHSPEVDPLQAMAGETEFVFHKADGLQADIEDTDLLVLDAQATAEPLAEALHRHAGRVRRYLVLHGTTTAAANGNGDVAPAGRRNLPRGRDLPHAPTLREQQRPDRPGTGGPLKQGPRHQPHVCAVDQVEIKQSGRRRRHAGPSACRSAPERNEFRSTVPPHSQAQRPLPPASPAVPPRTAPVAAEHQRQRRHSQRLHARPAVVGLHPRQHRFLLAKHLPVVLRPRNRRLLPLGSQRPRRQQEAGRRRHLLLFLLLHLASVLLR